MKFLNSLRTAEQTQEIILQSLSQDYRGAENVLSNNLPKPIKKTNNLNTFKHNIKNLHLNQ